LFKFETWLKGSGPKQRRAAQGLTLRTYAKSEASLMVHSKTKRNTTGTCRAAECESRITN